jgi:hypothetical protein
MTTFILEEDVSGPVRITMLGLSHVHQGHGKRYFVNQNVCTNAHQGDAAQSQLNRIDAAVINHPHPVLGTGTSHSSLT